MARSDSIAFCCDLGDDRDSVAAPALRLGLPTVAPDCRDYPLLLAWTGQRLELRATDQSCGPVYCDFVSGAFGHRTRQNLRGELLAKAVGFKGKPMTVVDSTAGLGRDAALLALLGCGVTAIERNPIVAALLEDGLSRAARQAGDDDPLHDNLKLIHTDATGYLAALRGEAVPDVIYLDPMFPARSKSALVKKELRLLGALLGEEDNGDELLAAAVATGCRRIVVKRSTAAPFLHHPSGQSPTRSFRGKAVRFDVYVTG